MKEFIAELYYQLGSPFHGIYFYFKEMFYTCKVCGDGDFLPRYGLAPHKHNLEKTSGLFMGSTEFISSSNWPDNFEPDTSENGEPVNTGVYFCPNIKCENHISKKGKKNETKNT